MEAWFKWRFLNNGLANRNLHQPELYHAQGAVRVKNISMAYSHDAVKHRAKSPPYRKISQITTVTQTCHHTLAN